MKSYKVGDIAAEIMKEAAQKRISEKVPVVKPIKHKKIKRRR